MSEIFLHVFNMSISASYIVLAILLLRLFMKKAPKWISVALWGVVGLRLICPFSIESILSLIPSAETVSPDIMTGNLSEPFYVDSYIDTGFSGVNNTIAPIISGSSVTVAPEKEVNLLKLLIPIFAILWLVGILAMVIYTLVSYLKLKKSIGAAVLYKENIYQSENVASPFILGIIKPRIYLPFSISEQSAEHVIAHEKAHLRRKDHLWKPLGFLLLAVYWFNPLMWLGYILLCRDIELACDEKVIKELDCDARADYSEALLRCGVKRKSIAACPLAFGEVGVKARIKSVLNYKKPAFWIIIVALVLCVVIAVCFLTNPVSAGVKDISVKNVKDDSLELVMKYYFPTGSYGVRAVSDDEGENLGNGMREYDGSLGEHRILISFGDTEPTKAFREEFPTGEAVEINSSPRVCVKRVHLNDNGFDLYVGFDSPVSIEEIDSEKLNTFFGKVKVPVSFVEDSDEGSENLNGARPIPDTELANTYPEYFGIDTSNGLDIYVWQLAKEHYDFGLLPHAEEGKDWLDKDLLGLKGVSAKTMREILSYYELDGVDVHIIPWQNPISSYVPDYMVYGEEVKAQYIEDIKVMLFDTPWLEIDPELLAAYPEYFGINTAKGLDVCVWQMAEEHYAFALLPHTDDQHDLWVWDATTLKDASAETMKKILSYYDLDGVEVHIVPWIDPTSNYWPPYYHNGIYDRYLVAEYVENIKFMLFGVKSESTDPSWLEYGYKEIENIVFNTMGNKVEDVKENFFQDNKYLYSFSSRISRYLTVIYKDGTTENIKDALANLHIKIHDLDKFGIEYSKTESNVDRIVFEGFGWDDATEVFYIDENYRYQFGVGLSYATNVYYKDGTNENVKDALESGRIFITALEWHGVLYSKVQKNNITIEELKALAIDYGEDLSWKHFDWFRFVERFSEQYIWICPIDNNYQLWIGGDGTDTLPDYIYLVAQDGSGDYIDVRTEEIDDLIYLKEHSVDVPEDFSFSLTWGTYGKSSYDSATGILVKNSRATSAEDYVTTHTLTDWEKECIYKLLMAIDWDIYPQDEEYFPSVSLSDPYRTLIITIRNGGEVTKITAHASKKYSYKGVHAKLFLDTCDAISDILEATAEWQALPR